MDDKPNKTIQSLIDADPIFEKAHQKYIEFTQNEELMELYRAREKQQQEYKSAYSFCKSEIEIYQENGKKVTEDNLKELVHKMKERGYSVDLIVQVIGLPKKVIESF